MSEPAQGNVWSQWRDSNRQASSAPTAIEHRDAELTCLRCGFEVVSRPWGCKNPCRNCGFVYPLGDCSD